VADDDIRNPGDDTEDNRTNGIAIGIGVVVVVVLILMAAGAVYTQAANRPAPTTCSTSCLVFVKTECPGNRVMGGCFGYSVCDRPLHTCGVNPP